MSTLRRWPIFLFARIVPAALTFGGIALYTRLLDPTAFGLAALLTSYSFFVGVFGYSWLRVAVLRMLASLSPEDEPDYLATIVVSFLIMSVGVLLTIWLILFVTNPKLPLPLYAITSLSAVVASWFEFNVTIAQTRLKMVSYGILQGSRALVTMIATLVLIHFGHSTAALIGGYAIGSAVAFTFLGTWRPALHGRFRKAIFMRFFRFGWSVSLNSVSSAADAFQRFLLNLVGGSAAVGSLTAASSISDKTISILVGTTALAGQPLTFRARDLGSAEELKTQIMHNARLIFTVGFGTTVGIIALSDPITNVYLGEKFRHGAQPIIILAALTALIGSLRVYYFEQIFEISLAMRPLAIMIGLRTALLIGLGSILIPRFSAMGAVVSLLATETIQCTTAAIWGRRHIAVPLPFVSFLKTILSATIMVMVIQIVPHRNTLTGIIAASVAAGIAFGAAHLVFYRREVVALARVPRRFQSSGTTP